MMIEARDKRLNVRIHNAPWDQAVKVLPATEILVREETPASEVEILGDEQPEVE